MSRANWLRRFAVRGVFWRHYLDWAIVNLPFYFYPVPLTFFTLFFFFFAAPARRAIVANLAVILPGSSRALRRASTAGATTRSPRATARIAAKTSRQSNDPTPGRYVYHGLR